MTDKEFILPQTTEVAKTCTFTKSTGGVSRLRFDLLRDISDAESTGQLLHDAQEACSVPKCCVRDINIAHQLAALS